MGRQDDGGLVYLFRSLSPPEAGLVRRRQRAYSQSRSMGSCYGGGFFFAAKSAWDEKDKQLQVAQKQLLDQTVPNLEGSIEGVFVFGTNDKFPAITFGLSVTNHGAPSIARLKEARIRLVDGRELVGYLSRSVLMTCNFLTRRASLNTCSSRKTGLGIRAQLRLPKVLSPKVGSVSLYHP